MLPLRRNKNKAHPMLVLLIYLLLSPFLLVVYILFETLRGIWVLLLEITRPKNVDKNTFL